MARTSVLIAFATSLLLAACADTSAPGETRTGRYTLRSINGSQPPRAVYETTVSEVRFLGGTLHLRDDATFTDSTQVQVFRTQEGVTLNSVDVATGTYRLTTDTVYLESNRGERYHMTFGSSGSLVQELAGSILLYRK